MSKKDYNEIYQKAKENSVGKDKIDLNEREKKSTFKIAATKALLVILTVAAIAAINHKSFNKQMDNIENIPIETQDFEAGNYALCMNEIDEYGKNQAQKLLDDKGFITKNSEDIKSYDYDTEKFKTLGNLNVGQIYSLNKIVDYDTMQKILNANGYDNMDDYMKKNDYVDSKGISDFSRFMLAAQDVLAQEMLDNYDKGETKQWK